MLAIFIGYNMQLNQDSISIIDENRFEAGPLLTVDVEMF